MNIGAWVLEGIVVVIALLITLIMRRAKCYPGSIILFLIGVGIFCAGLLPTPPC